MRRRSRPASTSSESISPDCSSGDFKLLTEAEAIRAAIHQRTNLATSQFRGAIRPIYRESRQTFTHVGSCTLVEFGGSRWIVTAAHVIDQHIANLSVGGSKNLVPLEGDFHGTAAPGGIRDDDKFDFSAAVVTDRMAEDLGDVRYIGEEFISKGRRTDEGRPMYTCVGYPNSRNKDIHAANRHVGVRLFSHTSFGYSKWPQLTQWAEGTEAHMFVEYGKYGATALGDKRNAKNPKGASGGPVFYIGQFGELDTYRHDANYQPMLEAIIIRLPPNGGALVSVKMAVIIDAMKKAGLSK